MKRIDVLPSKPSGWVAKSKGDEPIYGSTKAEVVSFAIAAAKASPTPVSVRIHKKDGTIQEERTYPRSADPSSSKGLKA